MRRANPTPTRGDPWAPDFLPSNLHGRFAYLNNVPKGGATRFPKLPGGTVTVKPQRGKALLWPSVLADQPHEQDQRTDHEALPVLRGEKFGERLRAVCVPLTCVCGLL